MTRTQPNDTWTARTESQSYGVNCMAIITTGFYDDTAVWEDDKTWWDRGADGGSVVDEWTPRTQIIDNWN